MVNVFVVCLVRRLTRQTQFFVRKVSKIITEYILKIAGSVGQVSKGRSTKIRYLITQIASQNNTRHVLGAKHE